MTEFENVAVQLESNIFFGGNVTSRNITFADGSMKTLGVILPGEYEFGTQDKEIMDISSGELDVQLSDQSGWVRIKGGMSFDVPANNKFKIKVYNISRIQVASATCGSIPKNT